jgi:type I restriction enzyme S subunit
MSTYKIIKRNQFSYGPVTSRNGDKISIALLEDCDEAIVSQAYSTFEVKNTNELLPEYLMMWFRRPEFDRYARFMSHGSAREIFGWEEMCDTLLPIPSIAKQKEIVKEYNVIQQRIALKQKLIEKLEETAQAIYKQWFVDFEFPNENGQPYKNNGGALVFNEELQKEIPLGWDVDCLSGIATYLNGLAMQKFPTETDCFIPVIKIRELTLGQTDDSSDKASLVIPEQYIIKNGDVIFSWSGTLKVEIWAGGTGGLNQHLFKVTSKKFEKWFYYLWTIFHLKEFIRIAEGKATSLGHIKREHLNDAKVLVPLDSQIILMNELMNPILNSIVNNKIEMRILKNMKDLFLSKLTTIQN